MPQELSKPQPLFSAQILSPPSSSCLLICSPQQMNPLAVLFDASSFFPARWKLRERPRCSVPGFSISKPWRVQLGHSLSERGKYGRERAEKGGERRELQSRGSPRAVGGDAAGDSAEVPISPPRGTRRPQQPPCGLMAL